MNPRQLLALWLGIAAASAFLLFPPNVMMPSSAGMSIQFGGPSPSATFGISATQLVRYSFIFAPPAGSVGIDWQRFWIPVVFVTVLTAGAVVSLRRGTP